MHRSVWISWLTAASCMLACSGSPIAPEPLAEPARLDLAGGVAAAAGSWPMVGWLDNGCTDVLLAPELVLTSAHCGAASTLWLGDGFQVEVDEAAGTARAVGAGAGSEHRIVRCMQHPNGEVASGRECGAQEERSTDPSHSAQL